MRVLINHWNLWWWHVKCALLFHVFREPLITGTAYLFHLHIHDLASMASTLRSQFKAVKSKLRKCPRCHFQPIIPWVIKNSCTGWGSKKWHHWPNWTIPFRTYYFASWGKNETPDIFSICNIQPLFRLPKCAHCLLMNFTQGVTWHWFDWKVLTNSSYIRVALSVDLLQIQGHRIWHSLQVQGSTLVL